MQEQRKYRKFHWSWSLFLAVLFVASACGGGDKAKEDGKKSPTGESTANKTGGDKTKDKKKPTAKKDDALKATHVSVSYFNSFALMNDGKVRAWGLGQHGQTGSAIPKPFGDTANDPATPVETLIKGAVTLEASHGSTGNAGSTVCIQKKDGNVWCWGANNLIPLDSRTDTEKPVEIASLKGAKKISMGLGHACALMPDATVHCWGSNSSGEMGTGDGKSSRTPLKLAGLKDVVDISLGSSHSCAALKDGSVQCWGRNGSKQVTSAAGAPSKVMKPMVVEGITGAVSVMGGDDSSCALTKDGALTCWGNGKPANVMANDVLQVSGFYDHMCLIKKDHTVHCWGTNGKGELGQGIAKKPYNSKTPLQVKNITGAIDVSVGYSHSCAALDDGTVKCWGVNQYGELGDGTHFDRATPVNVKDITTKKLPKFSPGFGIGNVSDIGVEQKWEALPEACKHQEKLDVKHKMFHRKEFKVVSAGAKKSSDGNFTIKIANYKQHNEKGWSVYGPRADQAHINLSFTRVDDPNAEKPKKLPVDIGKYVFTKDPRSIGGWGTAIGNSHVRFAFKEKVVAGSHIELTHIGDKWICGSINLTNDMGHAKGTFAAKVQ